MHISKWFQAAVLYLSPHSSWSSSPYICYHCIKLLHMLLKIKKHQPPQLMPFTVLLYKLNCPPFWHNKSIRVKPQMPLNLFPGILHYNLLMQIHINNKIGITNIVPNNCHFVIILGYSFRKSYTLACLKRIDISLLLPYQ